MSVQDRFGGDFIGTIRIPAPLSGKSSKERVAALIRRIHNQASREKAQDAFDKGDYPRLNDLLVAEKVISIG